LGSPDGWMPVTRAALHTECANQRAPHLRAKPLPQYWLRLCSKWPSLQVGLARSPPEAPLMQARLLQGRLLPAVYAGYACCGRGYRYCWKFANLAETHKERCVCPRRRKNRLADLGWPEISVSTQAGWRRLGLRLMEPPSAAETKRQPTKATRVWASASASLVGCAGN
jgi:hypothetical protein